MGANLLKNVTYGTYISNPQPGETGILRNPNVANTELRETHHLGCKTVWESFEINLIKKRHKNNFIGYRKKLQKDELEKKIHMDQLRTSQRYFNQFFSRVECFKFMSPHKIRKRTVFPLFRYIFAK